MEGNVRTMKSNIEQAIEDHPDSEIFVDMDGGIWTLDDSTCPRCPEPAKLAHRESSTGYFNCPSCGVMYDEPAFGEGDIVGWTEDFED